MGFRLTHNSVNGVSRNNANEVKWSTVSDTDSATAEKTALLSGFSLKNGVNIIVKFKFTNTAENPTLNVNNTGAKYVQYQGNNVDPDALKAGMNYLMIYDDDAWQIVGGYDDNPRITEIIDDSRNTTVINTSNNIVVNGDMKHQLINVVTAGKVVTVPPVTTNGFHIYIKNNSNGNITVHPDGCRIDGASGDMVLSPMMAVLLISDGTEYISMDTSARLQ